MPDERDVSTFFEAGAKLPESSSPGGKPFPAKAVAFWSRKEALRKQPGRCCRCGKPNSNGKRQCPACAAYAAEYRARKRTTAHGVLIDSRALAALEKRVANLEHYFARLSTVGRVEYKRGYCTGRRIHRKAAERESYREAMEASGGIDHETLEQISHAYAR